MAEAAASDTQAQTTRRLLVAGAIVGPLYLAIGVIQALVRHGFAFGRHPLSVLANGEGGWVQTLNFVITGLLILGAALGIGRSLRRESRAAGWILFVFGLGVLLSAVFPADPMDGFPPGTPEGAPEPMTTSGTLHFVVGGIGFLALAISGFVVGRALLKRDERGLAWFSFATGAIVILGFMIGGALPASVATAGVWASVVVGFGWLTLLCVHLRGDVTTEFPDHGVASTS